MKTVSIAFRNIFRNSRRSAVTILAFSVATTAVLLLGGFISAILYGVETTIVQEIGHLHVYRTGFFQYGSGNPGAYSFNRYEELERTIREDPKLKDLIRVVTPGLAVSGIAGNFPADASKTFFGKGVVPSDRQRMREWNDYRLDYRLGSARERSFGITDEDSEAGIIGVGMARMLHLCDQLHIANCTRNGSETRKNGIREAHAEGMAADTQPAAEDFSSLIEPDEQVEALRGSDKRPRLDLLAATPSGAPNVVTMYVSRGESRGEKATDESFITMHLSVAQKLLFGKSEKKATEIVVQLEHTKDMDFAGARLQELLKSGQSSFEVKDVGEVYPVFKRALSFWTSVFTFITLNMAVIVLFTVINTMSMSVMERVNEIGTMRALGVRRGGVLRQFLMEGCFLGAFGATIGSALALLVASGVNASGLTWVPPNNADAIPLTIQILENPLLLPLTWLGLVLLAGLSSLVPARKAGRMVIVDALRHI